MNDYSDHGPADRTSGAKTPLSLAQRAPLQAIPGTGIPHSRRPATRRRRHLYLHFELSYRMVLQGEEILEPQMSIRLDARPDRLLVDHARLRHAEMTRDSSRSTLRVITDT